MTLKFIHSSHHLREAISHDGREVTSREVLLSCEALPGLLAGLLRGGARGGPSAGRVFVGSPDDHLPGLSPPDRGVVGGSSLAGPSLMFV